MARTVSLLRAALVLLVWQGALAEKLTGILGGAMMPDRGSVVAAGGGAGGGTKDSMRPSLPMRVAYQGEPGAYSEKSTRELLGRNVVAVGRPSFEECFRAVASHECDYACLPVENSLGGSIHENYDLMLRYDLTIVAEHEFRVHHCLMVKEGVKRDEIKYAISHPQALAQCDNYLRGLGITPIPTYDTAGSAKMISEGKLPDKCTPENTAAIASDLAAQLYGLKCLDTAIEDDDTNFTRFLLLGRKGIVQYLGKKTPSKTSVVFTLPNVKGALYKALACFSLRDIDFSKIESRPTSASLLNYLKFRSQQKSGQNSSTKSDLPRFRYCFYLDFLDNELSENAQNALHHLREQADFLRVLGSYPQKSRLVGPVADASEELKHLHVADRDALSLRTLPSEEEDVQPLKIGIIGYGAFGQFLSKRLSMKHRVSCMDPLDKSKEAEAQGVDYFPPFESLSFLSDLDVVILAVPLIDFDAVVSSLPADQLRGKLIVEVCPLSEHPKSVLMRHLGKDVDVICSHPMFGPRNSPSNGGWDGLPFVYEKVRIKDTRRCDQFLQIFEQERCQMVEMTAEQHDTLTADASFVTHLTGRLLDRSWLPPTPVISKEYAALCEVADLTNDDSFDLFYGMFKYNDRAKSHLNQMRDNLAKVERQLAAKEAYLSATAALQNSDRQRLIAECKSLLQEVAQSSRPVSQEESDDASTKQHPKVIAFNPTTSNKETVEKVSFLTEATRLVTKGDGKKPKS
eukprot:CAMPEP_0198283940 /NCGR_PEP_ID=MMETSP1449-20131203/3526_1 /TAXON_ID=420275 /ORGANISM="Attheya septentrionalis, Strain CCMP2084" /LENGTH=740 /DNA_ID=CAMNT_0043980843 /DNA_START=197 /DNA_END=2419 /DNA_ORIENTATION=+